MSDYDNRGLNEHLSKDNEPSKEEMRSSLAAYLRNMDKEDVEAFMSFLTDAEIERLFGETDAREYV